MSSSQEISTQDAQLALRCAQAIAREAGKRILRARDAGFRIDYKGTNDLVTDVDRDAERFIREALSATFPDDAQHGEEYGEGDKLSTRRWLIDPIDGTTNFTRGVPIFCVSIALQVRGRSVVGVVYDPTRDELFSAAIGQGARLNGAPMQVSQEPNLRQALLVTGFPPLREGDDFDAIVRRLTSVAGGSRGIRRFGAAALDLAYVAAGRVDGFWEFNLNPWDTAAGYLMVREAGGQVTDLHHAPFEVAARSVVATNGHIHEALLTHLQRL